nr:hypothetical protein Itr_chr14CG11160 [Ipomoea trifida]GLL46441.1 hypothetical protein Itr_chr14CG11170 [Ipomoea trifida]
MRHGFTELLPPSPASVLGRAERGEPPHARYLVPSEVTTTIAAFSPAAVIRYVKPRRSVLCYGTPARNSK